LVRRFVFIFPGFETRTSFLAHAVRSPESKHNRAGDFTGKYNVIKRTVSPGSFVGAGPKNIPNTFRPVPYRTRSIYAPRAISTQFYRAVSRHNNNELLIAIVFASSNKNDISK